MATLRDLAPGLSAGGTLGDLAPSTPGLRTTLVPTNYGPDNEGLEKRIALDNMNQIEKGYRSSRISDKANWLANEEAVRAAAGDVAGAVALRKQIEALQQEAALYAPREQDVTKLGWDPSRIIDYAAGSVGSMAASAQDGIVSGAGLRGAAALTGFIPHPVAQGVSKALGVASYAVPFATNYLSNAGETYNEMADDKELMGRTTATERLLSGAGAGVVMGALDTVGDVSLLRRSMGGSFGKTADKLLDGGGMAVRTAKDSLLEGGTEVLQTGVQKGVHSLLNPNRDTSGDAADYWNSLAQGAIGSAPMNAAGNAMQSVRETLQNRVGEDADKAAGSKQGDEIDLRTGKTVSGADAAAEDILRSAAAQGTKFSPEQQARRDLLDGEFGDLDHPDDMLGKVAERYAALSEELARKGADPQVQKIMGDLDEVDLSDPLANEHPAMKAAADYVRPYAGLSDEELSKAVKGMGRKGRKLSLYEPTDNGMLGEAGPNVGGVDTSKMAPADKEKFAERQAGLKAIAESGKNAAALLESSFLGGRMNENRRAPAAERKAFRTLGEAIATIAHIKGDPTPGELFTAERYGRILGSLLKGDTTAALTHVGAATGAAGKPLFSAMLGAATRAAGQQTRETVQQEKVSRDAAADQMISLIPKNTLTALTNKGVNLQGDENQRHFMLDGLESFFQDGDGPFTEAKLTAMLGKETLGKLKELFDAPIEPRFDAKSSIDVRGENESTKRELSSDDVLDDGVEPDGTDGTVLGEGDETDTEFSDFAKEHAEKALDRGAPERLLFSHGQRDTPADARSSFSRSVVAAARSLGETLTKGMKVDGKALTKDREITPEDISLPSIARLPELMDDGSWNPDDMLHQHDEDAKDIEVPMGNEGGSAVLPANSKLWRVAKYALDRFAPAADAKQEPSKRAWGKGRKNTSTVYPATALDNSEKTGLQPSHAVRLSTVSEELDAQGVSDMARVDLMLAYMRKSKQLSAEQYKMLRTALKFSRTVSIGLEKVNRILDNREGGTLASRAAKHLEKGELEKLIGLLPTKARDAIKVKHSSATGAAATGVLPSSGKSLDVTRTRELPAQPASKEAERIDERLQQMSDAIDRALGQAGYQGSKAERLRTTLLALAKGLKGLSESQNEVLRALISEYAGASSMEEAAKNYFDNRFMVVAEKKTNRDHDKMTAQDIKTMIDSAKGRVDAAEKAGIGAGPEEREQLYRRILADEGTILFVRNGKEHAVRARDLVNWARSANFDTSASDSLTARDKGTSYAGYMNLLSQGIAALLDSGEVKGELYTYGYKKPGSAVVRWPLTSDDRTTQREFPPSFPVRSSRDNKESTVGRLQYGRDERAQETASMNMAAAQDAAEKRKADPKAAWKAERRAERTRQREVALDQERGGAHHNPLNTNADGLFTNVDRNEGTERDLEERRYHEQQTSVMMAAKEAKEIGAKHNADGKSIAAPAPAAGSMKDQNRAPTKGADGKWANPKNPEVVLNPEQAKADQRRADWLRGELARLNALHLAGGEKAEGVKRRINALGKALLELEKRGETGPKTVDIKPPVAEKPTTQEKSNLAPAQAAPTSVTDKIAQDAAKDPWSEAPAVKATEPKQTMPMKFTDGTTWAGVKHVMAAANKGKSTMQLIKEGVRTATTRNTSPDVKVGDIIRMQDGSQAVDVRVTKAPYQLKWFGDARDDANAQKWSALEGWAPEVFRAYAQKGAWQFQYELAEKPAPAPARTPGTVQVRQHPGSGYAARTKHNVDAADVTVAIAEDPNTAGEKLTKRLAGPKFFGVEYALEDPAEVAQKLAAFMKARGATSLNIAGNGIYTLYDRLGVTQAEVNQEVYNIIAALHAIHPLSKIVSGGQTGVDIAGAVAAKALGIPAEITLPAGYRQRNEQGVDFTQTRADVGKQIVDGAAALETKRQLSTYEAADATTENTASERPDPVTQAAPSDADLERVRAHLGRMLGDKIKVSFEKAFDAAGEWVQADKTIKLAISSVMPMLSTANHEAMHAFMSEFVKNHPAGEMLLNLVQNPRHLDRLEAILKQGKDGGKAAIAQMRADPHEALAYTFQFWAEGVLPIDRKPQGVFQKIQRFLREVLGLVRDSEKALDIFQALYDGKMAEPSAAQKALDGVMAQGERGKQMRQKADKQIEGLRSLAMTSHYMMRNSKSETMRDIAAKFFTNAGSTKLGTESGILNRRDTEMKKWKTELSMILRDLTPEDIASMAKHDNEKKWEDHPDPTLNKRLKMLYDFNSRFRTEYLLPAGVEIGMRDVQQMADGSEQSRYTPMVWDVDTLVREKDKFFDALKQEKYSEIMGDMLARMRALKPDAEMDDVIDAIYQLLIDRNGVEESGKLDAQREDGVLSPFFASENARKLDWIDPADRGPFLSKDLVHKMTAYISQGVRAAEYVRTWGAGGKILKEMLVRQGDVIGMSKDGPITADEDGPVMKELREAAAKEKVPADQVEAWVQRRYDDETRAIGAMEGVLGKDISENMRKLNSGLQAYQHARLLPLAVFSSMLDPNNILVSGGKLDDMIYAYVRGMKAVFRTWKNLATGTGLKMEMDRDALDAMAVGAIDNDVFLEQQGAVRASEYMTDAVNKFNGKFFLFNGLTMWDRQMRISATRAGMAFIQRNVKGEDVDSERKLKALGLTAEQVVLDKDGQMIVDPKVLAMQRAEKKAGAGWGEAKPEQRRQWALNELSQAREDLKPQQEAVKRFVQRSVLSPNAAQRPAWASDPHYASLFHLKSFTYSFQETILTHAREEAEAGNYKPGMQLLAGVPIMIAADIVKALITGGGSLPGYMANWGVADWVLHGFGRAGMGGVGEIGMNGLTDPSSLFGPGVDQLVDTIKDPAGKFSNLDMIPGLRILRPNLGLDVFDHADW